MAKYFGRFVSDSYEAVFSDEDAFFAEIEDMEAASEWIGDSESPVKVHQTSMREIPGPLFVSEVTPLLHPGVHEETVYDAIATSRLFFGTPVGMFPMRRQATSQVISTALRLTDQEQEKDEINDPGFFETLYEASKKFKHRRDRGIQVLVLNDKVSACGSKEYAVMPIDQVFIALIPELRKKFGKVVFQSGYNSFDYTKAVYRIEGDGKKELEGKYEKMMQNYYQSRSVSGLATRTIPSMEFVVEVQTSNAKTSAATIRPIITTDSGARIPVGSELSVSHRKRGDVDNIELFVSKAVDVFAQFADPRSRFAALSDTVISLPRDCLMNLCKKAGLSIKLSCECANDLDQVLCGASTCTMFDIYLSICQMTVFAAASGQKPQEIDQIEEGIARILNYRWSEFDHEQK